MADMKKLDKFNMKRGVSIGVFRLAEADILDTAVVATLPQRVLVTNAQVIVHTASGTATSTIDVKVGATVVADEVAVTTAGVVNGTFAEGYFATGGDISVVAGAVAPATGSLDCELVIEYVELDKTIGEYTVV